MPRMSAIEVGFCRNPLWGAVTERVVVPTVLGHVELEGDVLEIGSGSGANASALLDRFPDITLTATDVDPMMRDSASRRLARFGDRAKVLAADATDLPFADGSFDAVVSMLMLHHVIAWRDALAEITRVLSPGGHLIGYDLTAGPISQILHTTDRSPHRMLTPDELRQELRALPYERLLVSTRPLGTHMRFHALRAADGD